MRWAGFERCDAHIGHHCPNELIAPQKLRANKVTYWISMISRRAQVWSRIDNGHPWIKSSVLVVLGLVNRLLLTFYREYLVWTCLWNVVCGTSDLSFSKRIVDTLQPMLDHNHHHHHQPVLRQMSNHRRQANSENWQRQAFIASILAQSDYCSTTRCATYLPCRKVLVVMIAFNPQLSARLQALLRLLLPFTTWSKLKLFVETREREREMGGWWEDNIHRSYACT